MDELEKKVDSHIVEIAGTKFESEGDVDAWLKLNVNGLCNWVLVVFYWFRGTLKLAVIHREFQFRKFSGFQRVPEFEPFFNFQ